MPAIGCAAVVNLTLGFSQTHCVRLFHCRFAADRGPRNLASLLQGIVLSVLLRASVLLRSLYRKRVF